MLAGVISIIEVYANSIVKENAKVYFFTMQ